jgi:hypothetical protein
MSSSTVVFLLCAFVAASPVPAHGSDEGSLKVGADLFLSYCRFEYNRQLTWGTGPSARYDFSNGESTPLASVFVGMCFSDSIGSGEARFAFGPFIRLPLRNEGGYRGGTEIATRLSRTWNLGKGIATTMQFGAGAGFLWLSDSQQPEGTLVFPVISYFAGCGLGNNFFSIGPGITYSLIKHDAIESGTISGSGIEYHRQLSFKSEAFVLFVSVRLP